MIFLIIFSFLAGIVTVLSPCILPILPIILSSSIGDKDTGKGRPIGIVVGFVLSFTFFTLFLSTIIRIINISADSLRFFSVIVILFFGISFLVPKFQTLLEVIFAKLSKFVPNSNFRPGFTPGILIGLSLGLLWTPCVGPILASVITLALTEQVTFNAFMITLAYSIGTAVPMFIIMIGGRTILQRNLWLLNNTSRIQKIFGVIMIITALVITFKYDKKIQKFILETFPNYGSILTKLEDTNLVKDQLKKQQ